MLGLLGGLQGNAARLNTASRHRRFTDEASVAYDVPFRLRAQLLPAPDQVPGGCRSQWHAKQLTFASVRTRPETVCAECRLRRKLLREAEAVFLRTALTATEALSDLVPNLACGSF
jgi:hypothetical protein